MRRILPLLLAAGLLAAEADRLPVSPDQISATPRRILAEDDEGRVVFWSALEITIRPDPATDVDYYEVLLEYTDLKGNFRRDRKQADYGSVVIVTFYPKAEFLFGTVTVNGYKKTVSASFPVFNWRP